MVAVTLWFASSRSLRQRSRSQQGGHSQKLWVARVGPAGAFLRHSGPFACTYIAPFHCCNTHCIPVYECHQSKERRMRSGRLDVYGQQAESAVHTLLGKVSHPVVSFVEL
jgi:hypothetical protein